MHGPGSKVPVRGFPCPRWHQGPTPGCLCCAAGRAAARGRGTGGAISVVTQARARLRSSALVRDGGIAFFLATGVANLGNFVFHVIMSRMLGPSTYGALGSILGLATVVQLAVTAFQAAVTQAVAERKAVSRDAAPPGAGGGDGSTEPDVRIGRTLRRSAGAGAALLALVTALSPTLRGFLHLGSVVPVVFFGAFVGLTLTTLVPQGVLIGQLRFRVVALALVAGAGLRLATGPIFVEVGWGLSGAVAATVVQAVATLAVLLWPLRDRLSRGDGEELRFRVRPAVLAVAALGGVSAFVGIDSFLARHYLPRVASGYYAAAATAARIALFLPAAIGMMAFPRLAAHGGRGPEARTVLGHALGAVAVIGGLAALVIAALPHVVIDVLFGARYRPAASALRVLAVAAAFVGLVTVGVYALLARRSVLSVIAWPAIGVVAATVAFAHGSTVTIAWIVLFVSAALVAVVTVGSIAGGRGGSRGGPGHRVVSAAAPDDGAG